MFQSIKKDISVLPSPLKAGRQAPWLDVRKIESHLEKSCSKLEDIVLHSLLFSESLYTYHLSQRIFNI